MQRCSLFPFTAQTSVLLQSLLLFFRLPSTLLPLAGHKPSPQPWVLYQNCQEDALAVWQALCFHMQFTPCPYPTSHDMKAHSQDSLQLWMRNNGLVFSGTYLGWWRTANPTQPGLSAQQPKVRLRHSPAPPPDFFILYSRSCIISLPSAEYTPLSPFQSQ